MIPFEKMTMTQSQFFDFGDKRLNSRAEKSVKSLINSNLSDGFPRIFGNQHDLKGFYRLMNNNKVTPEKITVGMNAGLQSILADRSPKSSESPQVYYQYQDTTFGSYLSRNKLDLGYLENVNDNGVVVHTSIVTDSNFVPLGIGWQKQILRDRKEYQKAKDRKKRAFEDKESYKWVESMEWSVKAQRELNVKIIHVADREGDMNELFNYSFEHELDFMVRARHNRVIPESEEQKKLWEYLNTQIPKATIERKLLDPKGKQYTANCDLYWTTIQPQNLEKPIQVVYLRQVDNLQTEEGAQWAIYTNLPVTNVEQAVKIFDIYTHRWRTCEDFHKCLKTGCSMEKRQFDSAKAMTNCIAILSLTALHLLRMRHLVVLNKQPINEVLNAQETKLAQILADKYLKPVDLKECKPNTVLWLVLILGRMGGHQGIRQRGLPGWRTLWLGWSDFKKLMDGIILSKNFFNPT